MAKRWEAYKNEIRSLYINDGRSLDDVRRIMKGRHKFEASIRSYRTKLNEWGLKKNKVPAGLVHHCTASHAKTTKKRRSNPAAGTSNAILHQDRNITSLPSLPTSQISNLWTSAPNYSDNLRHDFDSNNGAVAEIFHDRPAIEYVDATQEVELASHQSLFNTISNGSEDDVARLLSAGTAVNIQDEMGNSPLHAAVLKGNLNTVRSLLNYGADIDAIGFKRKTPLHLAISSEHLTRLLLKHSPTLSLQDDQGNTALHELVNTKNYWTIPVTTVKIKLLLSAGADINITNMFDESPLHRVISDAVPRSSEYMNFASQFLDHNPDVISPMRTGLGLLSVFLDKTELLPSQNPNPYRVFSVWINDGYQCLEKLLVAGADPNTIFRSKPLIIECLSHGFFSEASQKVLVRLIEKASLDVMGPGENYPLHLALEQTKGVTRVLKGYNAIGALDNAFKVIAALISRTVSMNRTNDEGASPLEIWLRYDILKHFSVTKVALLLVEAGADTMMPTSSRKTLFDMLSWLSKDDQYLLTKAFLKAGAAAPENFNNTTTPLEWVEIWRTAWKQTHWKNTKAQLGELFTCPSLPKITDFMGYATIVIAEQQLKIHKSCLKQWQEGLVGKEMVVRDYEEYCDILRDCRERGIEIDVSWYFFLLDLMDFKLNN